MAAPNLRISEKHVTIGPEVNPPSTAGETLLVRRETSRSEAEISLYHLADTTRAHSKPVAAPLTSLLFEAGLALAVAKDDTEACVNLARGCGVAAEFPRAVRHLPTSFLPVCRQALGVLTPWLTTDAVADATAALAA